MGTSKKKRAQKEAYHHGDLKRALMDAALQWISKEGAERLNLRELARRVGVSHGAPYRHFPSREDLIIELALEGATLFLEHLEGGRSAASSKDVREQFTSMGEAYFHFAIDYPYHYRLIFQREFPSDLAGPQIEKLQETMGASFLALVQIVQEMQMAGHIRPDDPFLISSFIWSQIHGVVSLIIDGRFHNTPGQSDAKSFDPESLFQAMMPYLLSGIGIH